MDIIRKYDEISEEYTEFWFNYIPPGWIEKLRKFVSYLPEKRRVLDAGCGRGGI